MNIIITYCFLLFNAKNIVFILLIQKIKSTTFLSVEDYACDGNQLALSFQTASIELCALFCLNQLNCVALNVDSASQITIIANDYALRAIDGNYNTHYMRGSCTLTSTLQNPWWRADIGFVRRIVGVKLWNRSDCCGGDVNMYREMC